MCYQLQMFLFSQIHENFFSVIKTLIMALGHSDPCLDMKKYANGLKPTMFDKCSTNILQNETHSGIKNAFHETVSKPVEHQVLIQNGSANTPNYSAPTNIINLSHPYNSKLHKHTKDAKNILDPSMEQFDKLKSGNSEKMTCRILLLFSQDGTTHADQAVELAKTVTHEVSKWFSIIVYSLRKKEFLICKSPFYKNYHHY